VNTRLENPTHRLKGARMKLKFHSGPFNSRDLDGAEYNVYIDEDQKFRAYLPEQVVELRAK
jgi:hypothetical protein